MKTTVSGWHRGYQCNRCSKIFPKFTWAGIDHKYEHLCSACGSTFDEWTDVAIRRIETSFVFKEDSITYEAKPLK